ncbi:tetratricopeptide repeat protein [Vibrio sp. Of7-15]|uniref:TPR domain-containing protein n=1 Tax=Vibrio sp. Of7-15 TaxID=2724879 RepID=UPI001EF2471D|nr:tetratricopeptide repeat protein [Vibrio sp. Of7-15]MCG7497133.1 tetratricopeptide repeat protein [Vibrio sp. Of7-15]
MKWSLMIGMLAIGSTGGIYAYLGEPSYLLNNTSQVQPEEGVSIHPQQAQQERITEIQNEIRKNTQDGDAWYALGHAYMYSGEFENAVIAFDYAIRLSSDPIANLFSAKASALYYVEKQNLTVEVQYLLDKALAVNPNNTTALMLMASDLFMNARYTKAITMWQLLLDSNEPDLDRVAIIHSINRAKQLL